MAASNSKKRGLKNFKQENVEIKEKTKLFLENKKNSNTLLDIIALAETDDPAIILGVIRSFHKIFIQLLRNNDMYMNRTTLVPEDVTLPEEKYKLWLLECYEDVQLKLLDFMGSENANVQELALCTLIKFLECQGHHPLLKVPNSGVRFPTKLYQKILDKLISDETDQSPLILKMQEYFEYDDLRYNAMKLMLAELKNRMTQENITEMYQRNLLTALTQIQIQDKDKNERMDNFLTAVPSEESKSKALDITEQKKIFTTLWLTFLKNKLSFTLYKKVLVLLHEKVMPSMSNPLLLSDFLTVSYNVGGAVSLLSLNGLFILISKYNLDYPDFYPKLYSLLDPSVFSVKYCPRFFYLTDLFLTSTHLPAYLVAAFAKKLARLSLTAPAAALLFLIPLIYNLIIRHPSCNVLINRTDTSVTELDDDPYNFDERDPSKSKAIESSLWEIKTLQNHFHPDVANIARRMNTAMPEMEFDLSEKLETTMDTLYEKELKKKCANVPITFQTPKGLFGTPDDVFTDLWVLN